MPDIHDDDPIFDEGAAAGGDYARLAIDCPYLPGAQMSERERWLSGFASARSSIPEQPPSDMAMPRSTPHAG